VRCGTSPKGIKPAPAARQHRGLPLSQRLVHDDIIFDSTNKLFCDEFSKIMMDMFKISMMNVLTFFLRF
jgi:hypothetical protein